MSKKPFRIILTTVALLLFNRHLIAQEFTSHTVKSGETLESIAKKYKLTSFNILRYNKEIKQGEIKPNTILVIPINATISDRVQTAIEKKETNVEKKIQKEPIGYTKHKVRRNETLFGIAKKYNISEENIKRYNMSLYSVQLKKGMRLKIPKYTEIAPSESLNKNDYEINQKVQTYNYYTVPKGIGFYRIEKNYGVTAEELIKLNPEIAKMGGLKEGMLIRIPKNREEYFEIKNANIIDNINLLDSINTNNRPRLVFMLPFGLDKLNLSDKENTLKIIEQKKDVKYIKYSLGFYSGALVALDSIKELGISVDVRTFDNQFNITKTKEILARESLKQSSAIIAPFDLLSLKEVATQAFHYGIPVISPFIRKVDGSFPNVFFSVPTDAVLQQQMLDYVKGKRTTENIVIIADRNNDKTKKLIQEKFTDAKICRVMEEEKNIAININELAAMLSEEHENWVFLETGNFKLISSVISILNSFISEEVNIKLWTTKKNKAFTNDVISNSHLSNLNFRYPSAYREVESSSFTERYKKRFAIEPDKYAVIGFDVTYDLLLKLAYKNNLFDASNTIGELEYTGHKFNYSKHFSSGYYNIASYIMMYKDMRIKQLK